MLFCESFLQIQLLTLSFSLKIVAATAAPLSAQGLSLCSGTNYVAHAVWTADGEGRVAIVDLMPPLSERSEQALPEVSGIPRLFCGANQLIVEADQRLADGSCSHDMHDSGHSELRLPRSVRYSLPETIVRGHLTHGNCEDGHPSAQSLR